MSRSVRDPDYRTTKRKTSPQAAPARNATTNREGAMMLLDDKGRPVYYVGTGSESFWTRPTNRYPGCTCPAWRYSPANPKPTNPECPTHGEQEAA